MSSSQEWQDRAKRVLPAGGFGNFDPKLIIKEGRGAYVWDVDGNKYLDFLNSSGPMVLGHAHPEVTEAVTERLAGGTTYFTNNPEGIELAEVICDALPCAEHLRYVSTGGEADMYAIRLARAYTGRSKILKFEGGYHGMSAEAQMSLAPAKLVNFPNAVPDSAGIPESVAHDMLIAPFNDAETAKSLINEHGDQIAAVIVEPLQRLIPPTTGFLQALRDACDAKGIVLIFDEVVTGFRFDYGGAQTLYGVTPDIATLGKIIGGGFPLAALAGKADIMACFDKDVAEPDTWIMHTGTLSGNPIASVAGLKTLEILRRDGAYDQLRHTGREAMRVLSDALSTAGHAHQITGDPTLFDVVFTDSEVKNYRDVFHADKAKTATFNKVLREQGILKPPGKVYASLAHTAEDIDWLAKAAKAAAEAL